jgi:histidinol-phosphatase (PHP family)
VLASVHSLQVAAWSTATPASYIDRSPADVVRAYLAEVAASSTARTLRGAGPHRLPSPLLARRLPAVRPGPAGGGLPRGAARPGRSGRALEINTRITLDPQIVGWWHDCGGDAVSFGSDAHDPSVLARGFAAAADMAQAQGFRPGRDPHDLWRRA